MSSDHPPSSSSQAVQTLDFAPPTSSYTLALEPSKPLPAEHPSVAPSQQHARQCSQDIAGISPRTVIHSHQSSDPTLPSESRRGKSVSLSIPVLPNNGYDHRRAASQAQLLNATPTPAPSAPAKHATNLKISIPPSSEMGFLTALASQERQVLELKEQLLKAEDELSKLKRLWVSQEAKKRQSEARGVHRMTSTPTSSRSSHFSIGAPPSVESMYEEMARRKASISESSNPSATDRPARRRFFSGSRQLRNLSLVTPPPISETGEDMDAKHSTDSSETLVNSPTQMPPTPDLIEEEDDDPSTVSTRSSRDPQRERMLRSSLRTSMQMATEFREGLWTFFEDLKQATVGEDARSPDALQSSDRSLLGPTLERKDPPQKERSPSGSKSQSKKQTVRRQTWQFRPSETNSKPPAIDTTSFWQEQGIAEVDEGEHALRPSKSHTSANALHVPAKSGSKERNGDGEPWQAWDSETSRGPSPAPTRSSNATPRPPGESRRTSQRESRRPSHIETGSPRGSAAAVAAKPTAQSGQEHFRRDSMAWPVLEKLKPGQLRQGVNSLLDDWERSLTPPGQQQERRPSHGNAQDLFSKPLPRPVTQRSNSRLDDMYQ